MRSHNSSDVHFELHKTRALNSFIEVYLQLKSVLLFRDNSEKIFGNDIKNSHWIQTTWSVELIFLIMSIALATFETNDYSVITLVNTLDISTSQIQVTI